MTNRPSFLPGLPALVLILAAASSPGLSAEPPREPQQPSGADDSSRRFDSEPAADAAAEKDPSFSKDEYVKKNGQEKFDQLMGALGAFGKDRFSVDENGRIMDGSAKPPRALTSKEVEALGGIHELMARRQAGETLSPEEKERAKAVVQENQGLIWPEKSPEERRELVRDVAHFVDGDKDQVASDPGSAGDALLERAEDLKRLGIDPKPDHRLPGVAVCLNSFTESLKEAGKDVDTSSLSKKRGKPRELAYAATKARTGANMELKDRTDETGLSAAAELSPYPTRASLLLRNLSMASADYPPRYYGVVVTREAAEKFIRESGVGNFKMTPVEGSFVDAVMVTRSDGLFDDMRTEMFPGTPASAAGEQKAAYDAYAAALAGEGLKAMEGGALDLGVWILARKADPKAPLAHLPLYEKYKEWKDALNEQ